MNMGHGIGLVNAAMEKAAARQLGHGGEETAPYGPIGPGGVDVAAPDPAAYFFLRCEGWQKNRLRIVHENNVRLQVQPRGIFLVDLHVQIKVAGRSATG